MTEATPAAAIVGRGEPELGGIPTFLDRLARGLRRDGRYEPHIVNLADEAARHDAGRLTFGNLRRVVRDAAIVWHRTADVAVMHYNCATAPLVFIRGILFCALSRLRGVPAVMHLHMNEVCEWGPTWWGRPLLRLAALVCDAFCAVSAEIADAIRDTVRRPVRYVENAVPVDDYAGHVAAADGRLRFVYLGVFSYRKGLDVLLDALRGISNRDDYTFRLVGGDPPEGPEEADRLRRAYGEAHLAQVTLERQLPAEDVPDLLRNCDVLVLPSRAEGLPMAVLEAMAAGLAVVATAVGHTAEAVEDGVTGILVQANDADALRRGLLRLLDDRDECVRLGDAAREVAKLRFDLPRMGTDVANVFDAVTGAGS